ncbi:MAG: NAD(P)/FAD-dependent oxidoreductase [Pseudomonadota bacterium]
MRQAVLNAVSSIGPLHLMTDSEVVSGRRIILAGGVRDHLPDIPGLAERWGVSVLHCPYCHGYELDEAPAGVLGASSLAFHQAMLVRDWGPVTLFDQGSLELTAEERDALRSRGVTLVESPIVELVGRDKALEAVTVEDGRRIEISGLYVAPRTEIVGSIANELGCDFEDGPTGRFIATDPQQATTIPGVFAAGDAAAAMSNATLSAAAGVRAGSAAHASLIFK